MVSLARPLFLLLLLPWVIFLTLWSARRWQPRTRRLVLVLRAVMVLLLVLALARPSLVSTFRGQHVVYLLDMSRSVAGEDYHGWINQSLESMGSEDRAAVVGFGLDTRLLKPFTMERLPAGTTADLNHEFTNIEGALRVAMGLLPADGSGRIVLITDGLENVGDSMSLAAMLAASDIPVDVVAVPRQQGPEVAINDISLPRTSWPGQQVLVEVEVESTVNTSAELTLLWGAEVVFRSSVQLNPGRQRYAIPVSVTGQGLQRVRATIEPQLDTLPQNNSMEGLSFVQAPPRVLLVEGTPGKGLAIEAVFDAAGIDSQRVPLQQLGTSLSSLAAYKAIYLLDVPAYKLSPEQLQALDSFVGVLGHGLVAVGGRNSFGLGLYQDTLLEAMLPVTMEVEQQEELPGLDLVLVIDRSGSMAGEKLDMAKSAALNSLDILKERDRLAVITFDTQYRVEAPLTPISQRQQLEEVISTIDIGGGTTIYPALEKAVEMLADSIRSKHIILLSDGVEGLQYNYTQLLETLTGQGITLSTIALGFDADGQHMEFLAERGNGRYYYVPDSLNLPEVFIQETVLAGGDYLVEEDFMPVVLHADAVHLASPPFVLNGYVAATAKPLAEVLMVTHRNHPLLSRWQYGLGRTMAFTSDSYGMWTSQLLAHPNFSSFWVDTLNWVAPGLESGDIALDIRVEGTGAVVSALVAMALDEGMNVEAVVVAPDGSRLEAEMIPAGRGSYQAVFENLGQGVYLVSARLGRDGEIIAQTVGGFAVPYSPEYRIPSLEAEDLFAALTHTTEGRMLTEPGQVFQGVQVVTRTAYDITYWVLLSAVLLWPLDVAARRLSLALPRVRVKARPPKKQPAVVADPDMERLLKAKKKG